MAEKSNIAEKPILMSAPMVRAILDGRKTQTRRVADKRLTPLFEASCKTNGKVALKMFDYEVPMKYGEIGDRLWVKETFQYTDEHLNVEPGYVFRATDPDWETMEGWKWKPSIFMPRAASRITLEITGVRVERLQDISEIDARDEGIIEPSFNDKEQEAFPYKAAYNALWESIHGKGSWAKNPWVWVLDFKRITP